MKEIGLTEKLKDGVYIHLVTVENMKEIGKKGKNMATVAKLGLKVIFIKGIGQKVN